jgi:FkbM family methyltransferase
MIAEVNNFTVIESIYGRFVINRHCQFHAESLIKTGHPHIQAELNKILMIVGALPENCVVVDAGANAGFVSIPIARQILGRGGTVYAFEVQRMMYYALCGTAALNDLENLHVHNWALGATVGALKAGKPDYGTPQDFGMFSLVDQNDPGASEQVLVTTVDSLALPRLDFFKIDVEGMEIDVLQGARETVRKWKPWCWVEFWKVDANAIKEQFRDLDYEFYPMDQLNLLCAPRERLSASPFSVIPE